MEHQQKQQLFPQKFSQPNQIQNNYRNDNQQNEGTQRRIMDQKQNYNLRQSAFKVKQNIQQKELPQKHKKVDQKYSQISIRAHFIKKIKQKLLKRKAVLLILNLTLCIMSLTFCLTVLISEQHNQEKSQIDKLFDSDNTLQIIFIVSIVIIISLLSSFMIWKGKVLILHCYWLSCMVLMFCFSLIAVWAYSSQEGTCEEPTNYIQTKVRLTYLSAVSLFCSDSCPCAAQRNEFTLESNSTQYYSTVLQCPGWQEGIYSSFFSMIEKTYKCSGWCKINSESYYTFIYSEYIPSIQRTCFQSVREQILEQMKVIQVFSVLLTVLLFLTILYTNYYIFMEKEDTEREKKKVKRKIKSFSKKMEEKLKTSQGMLE